MLALVAMSLGRHAKAPPTVPAIWPVAAPADIGGTYRDAAALRHITGDAATLACRLLAESLSLCFVKGDGGSLDYVTQADLSAWDLDVAKLEVLAAANARPGLEGGRPAPTAVDGMTGTYWSTAVADGRDAAGLLFPDQLATLAGHPVVVATPAQGALLFWVPGNTDFDRMMAVGVLQMYQSAAQPVSSKIYAWDGAKWMVWGEAVPSGKGDPLIKR